MIQVTKIPFSKSLCFNGQSDNEVSVLHGWVDCRAIDMQIRYVPVFLQWCIYYPIYGWGCTYTLCEPNLKLDCVVISKSVAVMWLASLSHMATMVMFKAITIQSCVISMQFIQLQSARHRWLAIPCSALSLVATQLHISFATHNIHVHTRTYMTSHHTHIYVHAYK